MIIIVAFWLMKRVGMEGNRVQLTGRCCNGKYGCDTLGCLISDPIRYILIKEKMHLIGSTLRVFSRNLPWTPMACNWSILDIPNIPELYRHSAREIADIPKFSQYTKGIFQRFQVDPESPTAAY